MEIYKDDVIEALETEPLGFGLFISGSFPRIHANTRTADDPSCTVCAVGAIFRSKLPTEAISTVGRLCEKATLGRNVVAPAVNWLSALSIFWEGLGREDYPVEDAREMAIDFVERYFPEDKPVATINAINPHIGIETSKRGMKNSSVRKMENF